MEHTTLKSDTPFRQANAEHLSINRSTRTPKCMVEIPVDPSRQSLTDEEVKSIKKDLIKIDFIMTKYARERKFRVDTQVVGQNFGIISFKPSRGAKPDKRGCFGVIKLRGNFASTEEADKRSDQLISEDDNLDIDMPFVGREFPLMLNNEVYTHSIRDVDTSKTITDSTSSLMKEKEEKDAKEKKKMVDQQRKLFDNTNEEEKETTRTEYDLYVQMRTKKASNLHVIDKCKVNIDKCKDNISNAERDIKEMDEKYPIYHNEYIRNYIKEIKQVGIDPKQMEIIRYMMDDTFPEDIREEINPTKVNVVENTLSQPSINIESENNEKKTRKYRRDPELLQQNIGLMSFIPSKEAIPDSDGCFGVMKLRGNFASASEAEKWCDMLIKEHDSYSINELVFVGKEHPLFVNDEFYKSQYVEEDLKDIITKVVKTYLKDIAKTREQEQKDMVERQDKLRKNDDKEQDKTSIEYYTLLNVKKAYNLHQLDEARVTIERALMANEETQKEIEELEKEYPLFKEEYLQKYIDAAKQAGNPEGSDTLVRYLVEPHELEEVKEVLRKWTEEEEKKPIVTEV
jgi:hypothetical protein